MARLGLPVERHYDQVDGDHQQVSVDTDDQRLDTQYYGPQSDNL